MQEPQGSEGDYCFKRNPAVAAIGMENSEEGVHVANHVQACDKPEQSKLDYFGLSRVRSTPF
jgi:hypothetical protein